MIYKPIYRQKHYYVKYLLINEISLNLLIKHFFFSLKMKLNCIIEFKIFLIFERTSNRTSSCEHDPSQH